MSSRLVHGFAWYAYPDVFGLDVTEVAEPGHPFAFRPGEVSTPVEVVYFRPADSADAGVRNDHRTHSYLVLTKTPLHPRVTNAWDSDPAVLTDKFKTQDGKVRIVRIIQVHHRHAGDLMEVELRVEEA